MQVLTHDPAKNKKVLAGLFENGVFYKKVTAAHFMRKESGYGIQEDVIAFLIVNRCKKVIIDSSKDIYSFDFAEYEKATPKDYGNGQQRFVSINRFKPSNNQTLLEV